MIKALLAGTVLVLLKFAAYFLSYSNAILTDAAESIINVIAAGFALFSISLAAVPKDRNHPYGHGKIEFFSVGFEGALILVTGASILVKSVYNVFYPHEVQSLISGSLIIAFTAIVNFVLGNYLIRNSRLLASETLYADGKHLVTDSISSFGLIAGLLLIHFTGFFMLDSILSVILSIYIIYNGYKLIRKSVAGLMDETDMSLVEKVIQVLRQNRKANWIDIHNLRVQRYGSDLHIDCHVTMPFYYSLEQVHEEISHIEKLIAAQGQSNVELFIHVDPCQPECCDYCSIEACPARKQSQQKKIEWDNVNMLRNQKHFRKDEL